MVVKTYRLKTVSGSGKLVVGPLGIVLYADGSFTGWAGSYLQNIFAHFEAINQPIILENIREETLN